MYFQECNLKLTELAKEQIFRPTSNAHIRLAIEKFMKNNFYKSVQGKGRYYHGIRIMTFKGTSATEKSEYYEIFINKDDLTGLNIQTWGSREHKLSKEEIWECMADKHPDDPFWTK